MMDKTKEKVAHTPAVGVAGEQPSYMYNNTIIADAVDYGNLQITEGVSMFERMGGQYEETAKETNGYAKSETNRSL